MKLKDQYQISTFQTRVQFLDQSPTLASLGDFFIFDENTLPLFEPIPENPVVIPAGEKHKQLSTVEEFWKKCWKPDWPGTAGSWGSAGVS
jgi:hypothetical protein